MRRLTLLATILTTAWLVCSPHSAFAEIKKKLRVESNPSGAQVSMLEGTRRILLGTTPFVHAFEFHSEQSVLRLAFDLPGYEPKTVEVSASQDRVSVALAGRDSVADPNEHADPASKKAQEQLNPVLTKALPSLLKPKGGWSVDIDGKARVRHEDGHLWLSVPLRLKTAPESVRQSGEDKGAALARKYWDDFGRQVLSGLAAQIPQTLGLSEIALETRMDSLSYGFSVSSRVETKMEMECVPGYDEVRQWDNCAYYEHSMCKAGYKQMSIYNPCKTRVPVMRSSLKIDPKASAARKHEHFVAIQSMGNRTAKPAFVYVDNTGKTLLQEGILPDVLLKSGK